jgi:glycosyltransferase involved in cell wall biosynthesis
MVSEQQYRYFISEGYPIGTSWVIRNGVDLREYQPSVPIEETRCRYQLSGKSVILGVIGRLVAHKKQDQVILAFKDLLKRYQDCCLVIIGHGPEEARLKALCQDLGLNGEVRFLGEIEVGGELLSLLDIGIFLSEGEGSPFTLLELMAAKIPVIASDVCGINEIISHEKQGLLVPPDNVPALTEAMIWLIRDDHLRCRIASDSRQCLIQNHSIENMVEALQACYQSQLNQRK